MNPFLPINSHLLKFLVCYNIQGASNHSRKPNGSIFKCQLVLFWVRHRVTGHLIGIKAVCIMFFGHDWQDKGEKANCGYVVFFRHFSSPWLQIRCIFLSIMPISSLNPLFEHLLESSHQDDSNNWSNIGFGEEITQVETIEVICMHLIWSSGSSF